MNRELYPLLHEILDLDRAKRLEIVGVMLDSLAKSDVDREWREDAQQRYEAVCIREGPANPNEAPTGHHPRPGE